MDLTFVPVPGPHIADYIVLAVFLSICMGIGVYYGYETNRNSTLENYFFGNRRLLFVPVAMSLFVTFFSAISLMGIPTEVYLYGIEIVVAVIGLISSITLANLTFVPLLYPLQLTSAYEYLHLRFKSKGVRTIGTLMGMLQTIFYMGLTLYAPGLALQVVAGIPLWVSLVVIGLVGTVYTAIGGIKSVVLTDTFQCVVIFVGLIIVIVKGNILLGPSHSVIEIATEGRRLEFFNFDLDPCVRHTTFGLWIGVTFNTVPNWCTQASVQRVLSVKSLKAAKMTFWLMIPIISVAYVLLGYLGILAYSYYNALECDPLQGGFISNFNQLVPYFVLDVLRSLPGLSGIFISCLFSGALSTFSSGINALSANTVEDILGDVVKKSKLISQTFAAKLFVFLYGLAIIGLAYGFDHMSGSVIQVSQSVGYRSLQNHGHFAGYKIMLLSWVSQSVGYRSLQNHGHFAGYKIMLLSWMGGTVLGICGGPLGGLFFLGGMLPKANWIGAIVGGAVALVLNIWISIGALMYGKRPVKLIQNPTSGCFPSNNLTSTMNGSSTYSYNLTTGTTPYDDLGYSTISTYSPVTSDHGFFLYNVSYVWYGFLGFFLTLIIGTVVSLCTGGDRGEPVNDRFIFPICMKLLGPKSRSNYEVAEMESKILPPVPTKDHESLPPCRTEYRKIFLQSTDEEPCVPPI